MVPSRATATSLGNDISAAVGATPFPEKNPSGIFAGGVRPATVTIVGPWLPTKARTIAASTPTNAAADSDSHHLREMPVRLTCPEGSIGTGSEAAGASG